MAQRGTRQTCPRCGTNNFDTVTSCWKCGAPLPAASPAAIPMGMNAMPNYAPTYPNERPASAPPVADGDPGVARRAAIAMALTIPWIGLPVGWTFMMIEDSRKQAVGRVCVVWSLIALFFHLLLMYALSAAATPILLKVLLQRGASSQGSGLDSGGLGGRMRGDPGETGDPGN